MKGLTIIKTEHPKEKPAKGQKLGFGCVFTDHMLIMQWDRGQGWHDAKIVPYGPISISPASTVLHYAQETFEGMKAYRAEDGRVLLFRPEENFKRLNLSNERLCKNTRVGPPPGDFPTQGSNSGLPPCRWILYCLSHQGSPEYDINTIKY